MQAPPAAELSSLYSTDADDASAERTANSADTEKGEKTAENIRYGQNISESGMGGKTTEVKGEAQQGKRLLLAHVEALANLA